jgi:hypothetical protein
VATTGTAQIVPNLQNFIEASTSVAQVYQIIERICRSSALADERDFGCQFYDKFFFFTLDDLHFILSFLFFPFLFTTLVQLDFDVWRRLFRRTIFISSLRRSKMARNLC